MESNKQEKSNLLNDNPIARRAGGSWISKHSIAAGSPLHKGGSALYQERPNPSSLINAKGQSQDDVMKSRETDYNTANKSLTDFQNTFKNATFSSQGEVDTYNNEQNRLLNATNERADAYNTSNDSISNVNKAYNKKVTAYNNSIAPTEMKGSALKQKEETYAERQARLKKEKKEAMERLAKVKAEREARNAADANNPKPKQQTKLQALKAKIVSDLTGKTTDKPRSQS